METIPSPVISMKRVRESPGAYDLYLDNPESQTYDGISYREIAPSKDIRFQQIPEQTFNNAGGGDVVLEDIGKLIKRFLKTCIFHEITEKDGKGCAQRAVFYCPGPMYGILCHYYTVYRPLLKGPPGICYACWCPRAVLSFGHPGNNGTKGKGQGQQCTDRSDYEEVMRGLPYIVWRVSDLRKLVFTRLGCPELANSFESTVDWASWLMLPASRKSPALLNLFAIVWAYAILLQEDKLPKGRKYEFDSTHLFIFLSFPF